jgi:pimeloyl-ACP methyl ester carboxylesterase
MKFSAITIQAKDGATLAVWDNGNKGIPIVFVHGFPETHLCWHAVLDQFSNEDIQDYRIILYDLRGFGESSRTGEASLTQFYHDHQTIISELNLNQYHLVGHDWGGAIALHVARFNAEQLLSLSVMNTNYWKTDIMGMWHMLFFNIPLLPSLVFSLAPDPFFKFSMVGSFINKQRLTPETREVYLEMFRDKETTQYWTRLYRNMGKLLLRQRVPMLKKLYSYSHLQLPESSESAFQTNVQLIWGGQDRFNPLWVGHNIEEQLKKRGAKVSINVINNSGHFVQEEQPAKVAEYLLKQWRKSSGG